MIVLTHQNDRVISIRDLNSREELHIQSEGVVAALPELAQKFPDRWIIWVDGKWKDILNLDQLSTVFHHKRIMASFAIAGQIIPDSVGYVDQSCFVKVNHEVCYPTWLMSGDVGGVHAEVVLDYSSHFRSGMPLGYCLSSLARTYIQHGLFCYSDPQLTLSTPTPAIPAKGLKSKVLFQFVREHYPLRWSFILLYCLLKYENKIPLWSMLFSLFKVKRINRSRLDTLAELNSTKGASYAQDYDVVVPTLGRKEHLYNYLKDLSQQTNRPKRVIIVEQNPDKASSSELDYLQTEHWPFELVHHFIHRMGACNARNMAFKDTVSEWVVLGDDDIRVSPDLYQGMITGAKQLGVKSVIGHCPEPGKVNLFPIAGQTTIFGSGLALVHHTVLKVISFDLAYEFGYGEDSDFGMQIRNYGEDVIYLPDSEIIHLKVSSGGFRTPFVHPWDDEKIAPKPSPTVMLNKKKHFTTQQQKGYRLILYTEIMKRAVRKFKFAPLIRFRSAWRTSEKWADYLIQKSVH